MSSRKEGLKALYGGFLRFSTPTHHHGHMLGRLWQVDAVHVDAGAGKLQAQRGYKRIECMCMHHLLVYIQLRVLHCLCLTVCAGSCSSGRIAAAVLTAQSAAAGRGTA